MSQDMFEAAYRNAFETANAELNEIVSQFDQLRMRKERIEKMVEVLKPLLLEEAQSAAQASPAPAVEQQAAAPAPEAVRHDDGPSDYHFLKIGESAATRYQPAASGWPSILPRH